MRAFLDWLCENPSDSYVSRAKAALVTAGVVVLAWFIGCIVQIIDYLRS
jgi:hypothetical protein